jgi:hypothetical protein
MSSLWVGDLNHCNLLNLLQITLGFIHSGNMCSLLVDPRVLPLQLTTWVWLRTLFNTWRPKGGGGVGAQI